jgi:hypothetical protein
MTKERHEPAENWLNCMTNSLRRAIGALRFNGTSGDFADAKRLEQLLTHLNQEESDMEPFKLGNQYTTQEGKTVVLSHYGNEAHRGTAYETMVDEHGIHRYTHQGRGSGRVTGSPMDFSDPRNVQPLFRRPPPNAVPALTVVIPEGYTLIKDATRKERDWPFGTPGYGNYQNDCHQCGRGFVGDRLQPVCYVCNEHPIPPLLPTRVQDRSGPDLHITTRNYVGGVPAGEGTMIVRVHKDPMQMSYGELISAMEALSREHLRRLGTLDSEPKDEKKADAQAGGSLRQRLGGSEPPEDPIKLGGK